MASIFLVRHQAGNVIHEYPFAQRPSEQQLAAVKKLCLQRHGFSHAKTPQEPYWVKVVEVELLGPNQVPDVPDVGSSVTSSALVGELKVEAKGEVKSR
jgi:hypothetical protein